MNQKELETLQNIFGNDRVFVIDEKIQISKLPKLRELFDENEIEDRGAWEAMNDERTYQQGQ